MALIKVGGLEKAFEGAFRLMRVEDFGSVCEAQIVVYSYKKQSFRLRGVPVFVPRFSFKKCLSFAARAFEQTLPS